jgi:transcriptional regulator with XRE-family HTH domain
MAQKLPNYLRTYRKRAGLTEEEMASLLGCRDGTKAGRYECFRRLPELTTVFAYEVVFRIPARELFGGVFEQVKRVTIRRVRALYRRLRTSAPDRFTERKLAALRKALEFAGEA